MSNQQHTPEPWSIGDAHMGGFDIEIDDGELVAVAQTELDARRIVACVNACAGIPTSQLDAYPGSVMRVMKERDELLASERKLSDAYIRLREKLSAFDTPAAPTADQVYAHTEAKLDSLIQQRDELLAAQEKTCTWSLEDDDYGTWAGSCGALWCFIDGGPEENSMNFCPQCGGKVVIASVRGAA